jgi:hypothetical protein
MTTAWQVYWILQADVIWHCIAALTVFSFAFLVVSVVAMLIEGYEVGMRGVRIFLPLTIILVLATMLCPSTKTLVAMQIASGKAIEKDALDLWNLAVERAGGVRWRK